MRLCKAVRPIGRVEVYIYSFFDHGTRRGWGVNTTLRPLFTPEKDPVHIVQEIVKAPGPVWTDAENLAPTEIRSRTVQPVTSRYADWAMAAHA
jgi:hypothetical protein